MSKKIVVSSEHHKKMSRSKRVVLSVYITLAAFLIMMPPVSTVVGFIGGFGPGCWTVQAMLLFGIVFTLLSK